MPVVSSVRLMHSACCSVFTCKLESKTVDAYGTSHIRSSRLHLVDLAGAMCNGMVAC